MESIISKIVGFISKNDIPVETSPFSLKYENIQFMWGKMENPKFEMSPLKEPFRWVRSLDNDKFFIAVRLSKDSEWRNFPVSDEDYASFIEVLKKKNAEWDVKRLSQIESVLNG